VTQLHTTSYGTTGSRVVFLHGLFGQGRNWTTPARAIAERHRTTLVDMPNHGRSEWTDRVDYVDMADAVGELLASFGEPVDLVGHSMGGKAAMMVALRHPEQVARLMVVDSSPVAYSTARDFISYVAALRGVDLSAIRERDEADAALAPLVPSPTIRAFLLQNLRRDARPDGTSSWRWQPNLEVIGRDLDRLAGWPAEEAAARAPYDGPVLWVAGETSDYIRPEYADAMRALFPHYRKVTVKGAGHWVHSEQPEVFVEILRGFVGDS
jgi:pimeloyl-ACP methyl ester carboxylesterase